MTARSHDRGWQTELLEGQWVYSDTKNPVDEKRLAPVAENHQQKKDMMLVWQTSQGKKVFVAGMEHMMRQAFNT